MAGLSLLLFNLSFARHLFATILLLLVATQTGKSQSDIGYFWHLTDLHWDPTYQSSDVMPWSCGSPSPDGTYGPYGDYRCDSPWNLINNSIHATRQLYPDVDFLVWTGDDTPHIYNDTILNQNVVLTIISNITDLLLSVWPDRQVYSALGNHDWSPKSQVSPDATDPLYDHIAEIWEPWLAGENANQTFREGGYYTLKITNTASLRAIVLNTNLYYESNKLTASISDPADQLQWLDGVLSQARQDNEKVLIFTHIPPGNFEKHEDKHWFYPQHNDPFVQLLKKYSDVIGSGHMAHHHTDSFRLVFDENGNVIDSFLLAPAVTPWETTLAGVMGGTGNNPGLRLVKYNRKTGEVIDIIQYYQDLVKANNNGDTTWRIFYEGTKYYGVQDMGSKSLYDIAQRLLNDNALFARYYNANSLAYDPNEAWTQEMRNVHYCAISYINYTEYRNCITQLTTSLSARETASFWAELVITIVGLLWVRL